MRLPDDKWQHEFMKDAVDRIDCEFSNRKFDSNELIEWVEYQYNDGLHNKESPERVAWIIGTWTLQTYGNGGEGFFKYAVEQLTEGDEGEKLALGYIGLKALSAANLDCMD